LCTVIVSMFKHNGSLVTFVVVLNFEGYLCIYLICVMMCKNVRNSAINNNYNNRKVRFILLIYVCINYSPIWKRGVKLFCLCWSLPCSVCLLVGLSGCLSLCRRTKMVSTHYLEKYCLQSVGISHADWS